MRRRDFLRGLGNAGIIGALGLAFPAVRSRAQGQKVSLRLDFLPSGEYCAYYSAKEAGLWAKNGLDVEIWSGTGSPEAPGSSWPWGARTSRSRMRSTITLTGDGTKSRKSNHFSKGPSTGLRVLRWSCRAGYREINQDSLAT